MLTFENIRPAYVIIPTLAFAVMICAKIVTSAGMLWYKALTLPSFTPAGWVFSVAWQIIYTCTTIAAILIWDSLQTKQDQKKKILGYTTLGLFAVNAALNLLWTIIFFRLNNPWGSLVEACILQATVLALIALTWVQDKRASVLLLPYAAWLSFAIYLNYEIWQLNKATFYLFKWLF